MTQHDTPLEEFASGRFDPHRNLEVRDKRKMLSKALGALPDKLREAVVLRDIRGFSYQEIVEYLGLPEGTVKSRINCGRLELGRVLLGLMEASPRRAESAGKMS